MDRLDSSDTALAGEARLFGRYLVGRDPDEAVVARYVAAWVWIAPPALLGTALGWRPWPTLGAIGAWIVLYAALSWLHPQRQFWHDALCGTRLVPVPLERGAREAAGA